MKKMYKRFMAMSIAIVMILASSIVSLAKEETANVTKESSLNVDADDLQELIDRQSGFSTSTPLQIPFTVPQNGEYLYLVIASRTSINVDVHRSNGLSVAGMHIDAPGPDSKTYLLRYPTVYHYWPAGNYVLNISFGQTDQSYAITLLCCPYLLDVDG